MTGVTVEYLTCVNFLFNILPYLIARKIQDPSAVIHLRYIDTTLWGRWLAHRVLPLLVISVERLTFRLLDLRDEQGNLLRLTINYEGTVSLQKQICADPFFKEILALPAVDQQALTFFLRKSTISFVLYDTSTVWRLLMTVHIALWWQRQWAGSFENCILFAGRRAWMSTIKGYAAEYGVSLKPVFGFKVDLKQIIKTVVGEERLKCLYAFLYKSKVLSHARPEQLNNELKLVLEYYGFFNLDQPQYYSDFTFWQRSSFPGKNIVLASNLTNAPLTKEQAMLLEAQGMGAVALHPKATVTDRVPIFCRWKKDVLPSLPVLKAPQQYQMEARWFRRCFLDFHRVERYYHSFFETVGAKIYLSWFKYDNCHIAIAQAIQNCGGIMALYQRAMEQAPSTETAAYCNVFFGFNKQGAEIERRAGSRIPYYVVTGYLGDHRFALLRQPAFELRQKLMAAGAKKVLAFFDENSGGDSRWHTGHELMRENYHFLLEKMIANKDLGLVLKPKVPSTLRKRLGPVEELLERALRTGRCYLYENQGFFSHHPPVIAALSSDITIHGCFGAATAGLEAALAGVPTLLLDREGWPDCSLYRLGEGKVIFRNWDDLWRACGEHWRRPIDGFGDWSAHLDGFDPFRDGKASERMGTYLQGLLEGYRAKMPREQILAQAAERYARQWGKDKILNIG